MEASLVIAAEDGHCLPEYPQKLLESLCLMEGGVIEIKPGVNPTNILLVLRSFQRTLAAATQQIHVSLLMNKMGMHREAAELKAQESIRSLLELDIPSPADLPEPPLLQ